MGVRMGVQLIEAVEFVQYALDILVIVYFFIVLGACLVFRDNPIVRILRNLTETEPFFWRIRNLIPLVIVDGLELFVRVLRSLTEPVFLRIRKLMPFVVIGGRDFSPVVLMIALLMARIFFGVLLGLMLSLLLSLMGWSTS